MPHRFVEYNKIVHLVGQKDKNCNVGPFQMFFLRRNETMFFQNIFLIISSPFKV